MKKIALLLILVSGVSVAQQWVITGPGGTQQYPASMPYLYDGGLLYAQRTTDGVTMYAYRALPAAGQAPGDVSAAAFVVGTAPALSTFPSMMELDGRFYQLQNPGFIGLAPEWLIGNGSATNCRLPSGPLPPANSPYFSIGATRIQFMPGSKIEIVFNPVADFVRLKSIHGNVVCDGQQPPPVPPWSGFKSSFEDLP